MPLDFIKFLNTSTLDHLRITLIQYTVIFHSLFRKSAVTYLYFSFFTVIAIKTNGTLQ